MRFYLKNLCFLLLVIFCCNWQIAFSQRTPVVNPVGPTISTDGRGNPINPNKKAGDSSFKHRDPSEDSITIYYRFLDSSRIQYLDQSINDFNKRFPLPYYYITNGNLGNAARSYLFQPSMKAGFDVGFHAFDAYRFKIEETKIFQTTRPYTELGYMLSSKAEQLVDLMHTQNRGSNLNFGFDFRFINAPGFLRTQNANDNNIKFHTYYSSKNRRYSLYVIYQNNRLKSSENGGLISDSALQNVAFGDPLGALTRLGITTKPIRDPSNTKILTGNDYKDNTFLIRQQYDLGQRDSLVTDSSTFKLFYPRLRLQHTFKYAKYRYSFQDQDVDTFNYRHYLQLPLLYQPSTLEFVDDWREFNNEFSIISFPQKTNQSQFLKLGVALQNLRGEYRSTIETLHNVYGLAEYRNRTKNKIWDIEANGQLYLNGFNSGDYSLQINLKRLLSKNVGFLELGFENVNKTPPAIFYGKTSFPITISSSFTKENFTRLLARYTNPKYNFQLTGEYFLISNYNYFSDLYIPQQEGTLFNVLRVSGEKMFKLSRVFHLYSEVHLQQAAGNPPLNFPQFLTRNRLMYEGNLGYKNLNLATGIEVRYHSPYKADNYSPIMGQFVYQDTAIISNTPDINLFVDFRIKTFKAFVRLENINTIGGNYNFVSSYYPSTPLWFRLGIWWGFVN
jgi:hypothetical protein